MTSISLFIKEKERLEKYLYVQQRRIDYINDDASIQRVIKQLKLILYKYLYYISIFIVVEKSSWY